MARCRAVLRRARRRPTTEVLQYQDLTMDLATHRVRRGQTDVHLGPDRVPPAALPAGEPGPGVQPRAAAGPRLGPRRLCRAAHRRRAYPPPAQGDQHRRGRRPDPHRALGRLCAGCEYLRTRDLACLSFVIPRLGLGIHEFAMGGIRLLPSANSWMARPSLAMTEERALRAIRLLISASLTTSDCRHGMMPRTLQGVAPPPRSAA